MLSITPSHTSTTKSRRSSKHGKTTRDKPKSANSTPPLQYSPSSSVEKLVVTTTDVRREPSMKTSSPRPELPADTLAIMVGEKRRRSRCPPEFLEEVAKGGSFEIFEQLGRKFKIITGSEAVAFYKKFLGGKSAAEIITAKEGLEGSKGLSPSIVFAVTVCDAGRKIVDYYMTWRGKIERVKDSKDRKRSFMDSEFRKVARALDKEFKRSCQSSIYGSAASAADTTTPKKTVDAPILSKSRPTSILAPSPKLKIDPLAGLSRSPLSATDSVMSLPFLNMIRGVPLAHRVPLRVTNPDRLSMLSTSGAGEELAQAIAGKPNTILATVMENEPTFTPDTKLLTPEVVRTSRHSIRSSRSRESNKSSAASTASSESRRSKRKDKQESKGASEFLIVLLDDKIDKNSRTWHGLERQVSRSSTRTTPSRVSPWDGPLARDNGITYRTGPIRPPPPKGEESSSEEEWENSPVIPLQAFVTTLGSTTPEPLTRRGSLVVPANAQYMLANQSPMLSVGNMSPYGIPRNPSAYSNSSYVPAYTSPYQSPNLPLLRPLSRNTTFTDYQSPYVPYSVLSTRD